VAIDWGSEPVTPQAAGLGHQPAGGEKALGMLWELTCGIRHSRWRVGWGECSARLFRYRCCRCSRLGDTSRLPALSLFSWSVMMPRGTDVNPVRSLRKNFLAAA
jgi:hypothetical protein